MKHTTQHHTIGCGCRSVGECQHNLFAEQKALEACIEDFTQQLRQKLIHKLHQNKSGWDDPDWSRAHIIRCLLEHVEKGDMLDVAAFAMFAWNQEAD